MIYILGIITGIGVSILLEIVALVVIFKNKVPIERSLKQLESKLGNKGKIIEPEDPSVENWIDSLPNEL